MNHESKHSRAVIRLRHDSCVRIFSRTHGCYEYPHTSLSAREQREYENYRCNWRLVKEILEHGHARGDAHGYTRHAITTRWIPVGGSYASDNGHHALPNTA